MRATNNKMLNDNLETAKQGVANALRFALSVSDDENGNLVISKESQRAAQTEKILTVLSVNFDV